MQFQRFELKYIISEHKARAVRDFVRAYLSPDKFGEISEGNSYPVHSLYLDSADLELYRTTINGDRNRQKLRIRFYEGDETGPVFLEIKQRQNEAILKERCAVQRQALDILAAGNMIPREMIVNSTATEERALTNFVRAFYRLQARPVSHVSYRREAWSSIGDNRHRVTFDRSVRTEPRNRFTCTAEMLRPVDVFSDKVVLELKFTGRFPDWMREMAAALQLRTCSAAKYVDGLVRMNEEPLNLFGGIVDTFGMQKRKFKTTRQSMRGLGFSTNPQLSL